MSISWTNIENGESGASVRSKINTFNSVATTQSNSNATNIATNTSDITALDTRVTTTESDIVALDTRVTTNETDITALQAGYHKVGFVDYNDGATATTPISVPSNDTYVDITNDGTGQFTLKTYLPVGITDVWDTITNRFDWSQLSLGDMVDIRLDIQVTTTTPTQNVQIVLEMATGGAFPYEIPFVFNSYKTAGTYNINRYNGIYIGNTDTLNGGGRFRIKSDAAATVVVNGFYCKIAAK